MDLKDRKEIIKTILYRLLPSLLVFILALSAFNHGVYFEGKPNICTENFLVQIYYTIGLFLLAGIDLGMPVGGTDFHRILLYISYFLAPLITVIAVVEAVLKSIGSDYLIKPYKDHVVIVGASKQAISIIHGWSYPELQTNNTDYYQAGKTKIIVVEKDPNNTKLEYFRELSKKQKIEIIIGDINHSSILNRLNVKQALWCIVTTNSDILNINISLKFHHDFNLKDEAIITLVEDNDLAADLLNTDAISKLNVASTHRSLANCFLYRYIQTFFYLENLVIFGFGRFGQNILESLSGSITFKNLIIIDPDAEQKYKNWLFKKKLYDKSFNPEFKVKTYNIKQEDTQLIEIIKDEFNRAQCIHFILCAKLPDFANIKLAINLAESFKKSIIYLRSQVTLYEKLIGNDSRNMPYDIGVFSWVAGEKYLTEKEKNSKVLKHKFKYGGYHSYAIENMNNYTWISGVCKDDGVPFKDVISKPAYSNIHLFNELAELKHDIEFFNPLINPFFSDSDVWEFNNKDGFLKLVNFNKDSEGNQIFSFKID